MHTKVVVDDATAEVEGADDGEEVDSDLDVDDDDDEGDATAAAAAAPVASVATRPMTLARERPAPAQPSASTTPAAVTSATAAPRKSVRLQDRKLGASVRAGALDTESAMQAVKWVDDNVRRLIEAIIGCVMRHIFYFFVAT